MNSAKRKFGIFGGLLLTLVLATMAALPSPSLATDYPLTLTDDLGREVTIEAPPQRIISLAPSNTEILFELDLGDRVVGVTDYCNFPAEALDKPKIGGPSTPSTESIVALEPDLVLAAGINSTDTITTLEGLGLTVFGIEATDLDDLLNDINTVGRITDREAEAETLTTNMRNRINVVTAKTAGLSPEETPRTFHICWHDPIYTAGQGTFIHDLIEKAGGENIFADIEGYSAVDLETLIARDPEVIIVTAMGGANSSTWEWITTESRLAEVSARVNNREHFVESNWLERPGPRIVLGLEQLAKLIQPALFRVRTGGGGGGGIGDTRNIHGNIFGEDLDFRISSDGEVKRTIEVNSRDGRLAVIIPKDTIAKGKDGKRLKSLEVTTNENPPSPPDNAHTIGLAYNLGPSGATFDPPMTLEFAYDPDTMPERVNEEDLVLAYYDENAGEWVELECTVDTATHTITASVPHFTTFAIIGTEEEEPLPEPAAFTFDSLDISPTEVDAGEEVTFTVTISNTGGESGSCEVTLKINSEVETTEEVDIAAGSSQQVSFTTSKDIAGTYMIDVSGLTDSFVVKEAPAPAPPPSSSSPSSPDKSGNQWFIGGIIAAIATAIAVPLIIRWRRRA